MKLFLAVLVLGLWCLHALPVDAQTQDKQWHKSKEKKDQKKKKAPSNNKQYRLMASDLLGRPDWSERLLTFLSDKPAQIALPPLSAEQLPVSEREAQTYLDGLTRELIKQAGTRYAIVGRKELGALVKEIDNMGSRRESVNPLGDLFDRARSDLVAVTHLALSGEKILMSVKLVETESGRIVSSSQRKLKRLSADKQKQAGVLSLSGAVENAAQSLMRDLSNVRSIFVQGLRYQTSATHSDFSQYFLSLMSDGLRKQAQSGPRNINDMRISDFIVKEEQFRGLKLNQTSLERAALSSGGLDYILSGTYWVFDEVVEIRLKIANADGEAKAWQGRILKTEIPAELALVPPPAPIEPEEREQLGPAGLYLTSNKGENPLYRVGEKMVMSVRPNKNSHVACYYLQADGVIYRIFPNRFVPSDALNGGFSQYIPAKGMPFDFEFTPPVGVEAVKCFATDQDVSDRVAQQLGKADFQALPVKTERELTQVYRNLPQVSLSEASMIITLR